MRPARILFPLLAPLFAGAAASAEPNDTADYGRDRSFPWIARTSMEGFYLASPSGEDGSAPYQVSLYQGFTIQSLSFAWFHLGLRSRETYVAGFEKPYREAMVLKLQASVELLPGLAYASLGGAVPLSRARLGEGDTLALYEAMNGYNPLPQAGFLSPQALQAALFARYGEGSWSLAAGGAYVRPTIFRGIPGHSFYPPAYFDLFARLNLGAASNQHRLDARASLYGDEENGIRIPAHREGTLLQFRYEWLASLRKVAWQLGGGVAAKLPDRNRRIRLRTELPVSGRDENIQRVYGEAGLTWVASPAALWKLQILPKALFNWSGEYAGYEAESAVGLGLKVWEYHRARATGTILAGSFDGRRYLGFGVRAEFAFRHLGLQDADPGAEHGDGG